MEKDMKEFYHFPTGAQEIVRQELDRCRQHVAPRELLHGSGRRYGVDHWLRWRCWIRMRNELTQGYAGFRRPMTTLRIGELWNKNHGTIIHGVRRGLSIPAVNPYVTPSFDHEADFDVRSPGKQALKQSYCSVVRDMALTG
jgi:hypothetical protein